MHCTSFLARGSRLPICSSVHELNTGVQVGQGLFSVQSIELMQVGLVKHACTSARQVLQAHAS